MAPPGGIVRVPGEVGLLEGARFGDYGIIRVEGGPLADPLVGGGVVALSGPSLADIGAAAPPPNAGLALFGESPLSSLGVSSDPHSDWTNPGVRGFFDGLLRLIGFGDDVPTQILSVRQVNELRQACVGPDGDAITVVIEDRALAELVGQIAPDAITVVGDYPAVNGERLLAALRDAGALQPGAGGRPDTVFLNLPMAARAGLARPSANEAEVRAAQDRAVRFDLLTRVVAPLVSEEVRGLSGFVSTVLSEGIASSRIIAPSEAGGDPSGNLTLRVTVDGDRAASGRQLGEFERMINQGPLPEGFQGWEGMRASRDPAHPNRLIVTRMIEFRGTDGTTVQRDVTFFLEVQALSGGGTP